MMRILFWTFLAAIVVAVIWAEFASKQMTADQNSFVWGAVYCLVCMAFIGGFTFALRWFWKNRVAMVAGRYGGGVQFFRDTQPIRYWILMSIYFLALLVFIAGALRSAHDIWIVAGHILSSGQ